MCFAVLLSYESVFNQCLSIQGLSNRNLKVLGADCKNGNEALWIKEDATEIKEVIDQTIVQV
jgi:hypothetical protein